MRALFFAIVLTCPSVAYAQDGAVEIPFTPPANIILDVHETRTRTSTDERGQNGVGQVAATLQISGGEPPYVAIWTTTRVEAAGQVIVQGSPGAAQLLVGIPVGLDLGADGSPVSVRDWVEIAPRVVRTVSELTSPSDRTEEWRRAVEATERMFASMSPSDAARLLFQDVGIMALCQHTGLTVGEPLRSESLTPNPLGGSPIRTLATHELVQIDQSAGIARIVFTSTYDPESAAASVREMIENANRETGRTPTAEELDSQRNISITQNARADCIVDLETGIARSVTYDTSIESSLGRRTDRRELTFTPRE